MIPNNYYTRGRIQGLAPIIPPRPRILILGSMPGATSLRLKQYYGNKTNQFWKILAALLKVAVPIEYQEKKAILRSAHIGLWDVLGKCHRQGSSDASIACAISNNIPKLLKQHKSICLILLNGRTAEKYFKNCLRKSVKIPYRYVPSTSSAHASLNLKKKIALWKKTILEA